MTDADHDLKKTLLGKSFIFQALDQQSQTDLAAFGRVQTYKAGDTIFAAGSAGHSMMAIAQGAVRIDMLTPTSRNIVLTELTAGDVFGEIAMLDGGERSADAHAATNCTLVVLERRFLLQTLMQQPEFSIQLLVLLCARLRRSDERMMEFAFLQLPTRIAKTLLRMSARDDKPGPPLTKLAISQSEIADMIGGTRENVNRCLRKWQKAGVIDLRDGWLHISDRAALERFAEEV